MQEFLPQLGVLNKYWIFFFNDTATTEIYTLSLHDALPIYLPSTGAGSFGSATGMMNRPFTFFMPGARHEEGERPVRSEEHTSELQSHLNLVCRLLLEKKNLLYESSQLKKLRWISSYSPRVT